MSEQKIAVLGCGLWGRNIVRNFYNLNALGMVCDLDDEKERPGAAGHPLPESHLQHAGGDFRRLLQRPAPGCKPGRGYLRLLPHCLRRQKPCFHRRGLYCRGLRLGERRLLLAHHRHRLCPGRTARRGTHGHGIPAGGRQQLAVPAGGVYGVLPCDA